MHNSRENRPSGDLTTLRDNHLRLSGDATVTGPGIVAFMLDEHEDMDFGEKSGSQHLGHPTPSEAKYTRPEQANLPLTEIDVFKNSDVRDDQTHPPEAGKLGTWDGVVVSCLLGNLGIIVFIRIGWIVGNVGIGWTTFMMALSTFIVIITTLSMSAICTNKEMLEGGAYYLISRSLGPRFGGSIGILSVIGQGFGASLYAIGFGESFAETLGFSNTWVIRGFAFGSCLLIYGISLIGVRWVTKFQILLLIALILPFMTFSIGSFIPRESIRSFYTGYSVDTFSENWAGAFTSTQNFFTIFGVFFPAVTGFLSGANISGDLKDPARSVPRGTLIAIGFSTFLYLGTAWILASTILRSQLRSDYYIFQHLSVISPVVIVGMYVASLSSVLSSLVGGPRVLYSISLDRVLPVLDWFGSLNRLTREPFRASLAVLVVALGGIFIGTLNALAPLSSMFALLTYAALNYACFASATGEARLSWNPRFTFYNRWLSLLVGISCIILMFFIEWITASISLLMAIAIYIYVAVVDAHVAFEFTSFNLWNYIKSKFDSLRGKVSKQHDYYQTRDHINMKEFENR